MVLPLSLLNSAKEKPVLVELKNGETYNGVLKGIDSWMNLHITDVICTARDGSRFWKLNEIYIRGNTLKYLRIPDDVLTQIKEDEESHRPAASARGRSRAASVSARGNGRGGSRGGRGGAAAARGGDSSGSGLSGSSGRGGSSNRGSGRGGARGLRPLIVLSAHASMCRWPGKVMHPSLSMIERKL